MAEFAESADLPPAPKHPEHETVGMLRGFLAGPNLEFTADIRRDLQDRMWDLCGIVRTEPEMIRLREVLRGLRERFSLVGVQDRGRSFNTELMEAVELGFMLEIAGTVQEAALARDESRGGHYREDHPLRDDVHWLRHSLAYRQPDGSVRLEHKDVKMGPYMPMERKY